MELEKWISKNGSLKMGLEASKRDSNTHARLRNTREGRGKAAGEGRGRANTKWRSLQENINKLRDIYISKENGIEGKLLFPREKMGKIEDERLEWEGN